MTPRDFAYDRDGVSGLIRRIGREQDVPPAAFDRLEDFVDRLPNAGIADVIACFALLEQKRKAA
jgi:hypothetical protein